MRWEKRGQIYKPNNEAEWMNGWFIAPTPYLVDDETIRIYGCIRDKEGIGRIGYVDVEAKNPSKVIYVSKTPALDIGSNGCFDDNGLVMGDLVKKDGKLYLWYTSFQHVQKAKFYAFSGSAVSDDNGKTFKRRRLYPVMDRTEEGLFGRCIHTVIYDEQKDIYRVWYSTIFKWTYINNIPYPTYDIKYIESKDGLNFPDEGIQCIKCKDNEYRIGRPRVRILDDNTYEMHYTFDTLNKEYIAGYAVSNDGINWVRQDEKLNWIKQPTGEWDKEMSCYLCPIDTKYGKYIFYNGNNMGQDGFGYAELIEE